MNVLFFTNMAINLTIIVSIAVSIYYTKNPLLILGLYFLQPLPPLNPAYDEYEDGEEAHGTQAVEAEDYVGTTAGFTGTIKK